MRTGKISESVLRRSVLKYCGAGRDFLAQGAGVGRDCAVLCCGEGDAGVLHTQTLTVSQPGRMRQAVYTGANNLYCEGAEPRAVMLGLMLSAEMEESGLRGLMREAEAACQELGIALAGGHTAVSEAVREPVAALTVLGGKSSAEGSGETPGRMRPGLDVVLAGYPGKMGTALLAREREAELKRRFPWELVETAMEFDRELSLRQAARIGYTCGAAAIHDVSEGGIFGALWEFCESGGVGLEADLRRILLRQETVELCEYCGWNPYQLLSGGSALMAVPDGQRTADRLREAGIPCGILGRTTGGHDRLLHNGEECRFLDKPAQDEIWKLETEKRVNG